MPRFYYWVHHTGDYDGNTGVQRVVRNLAAALTEHGDDLVPVRWCTEREAIVRAEERWLAGLARYGGPRVPASEEAGTPLHLAAADAGQLDGAWLLLPEVPHVGGGGGPNLPVALDYARFHGMRTAAIFYDIIPLRRDGYEAMAEEHARYARALVAADLILAISRHSAEDLRSWWAEQGYDPVRLPRVVPLPLPAEMRGVARVSAASDPPAPPVRFLAVGTVEPRKNQVAAMRAFARLCARRPDLDLYFDVVGGVHEAVAADVHAIAARQPRIQLHHYLSDDAVRAMTAAAHATVFVSLEEGYGLPIAESLWLGRPCLCSDHGSMAEIAADGGCLTVPAADGDALERGFERLADDTALRLRLSREACSRPLETWADYASAVRTALASAPILDRLVMIEGSRGAGNAPRHLSDTGVDLRFLHWRVESRALLPGRVGAGEAPPVGAGLLRGLWAVLPEDSADGPAELREILDVARGLGLRVALEAGAETPPALLAAADVALFPDDAARDAALAIALRDLPRTVTLRERFRTGTRSAALDALAPDRPRIAAANAPVRPSRVYYWVGLTVTQPFNTGIQRVTRLLAAGLERLGVEVVLVKWDDVKQSMVPVTDDEAQSLARMGGPSARQPVSLPDTLAGEWLLLPEVTVPVVPPNSNVVALGHSLGMRVASVFYDLIPAKMPELYPPLAQEYFNAYWRGVVSSDVVLPISWTVAADLQRWRQAEGLPPCQIVPCALAGDVGGRRRITAWSARSSDSGTLNLLAVGTFEPRKNYLRLLRALAKAQETATRPIALTIVGRRSDFPELDAEISDLADATGTTLRDHVSDGELQTLYEQADATVFASWEEGFGLPVLESLWLARPCLCHHGSALAEVAPGGGALLVDMLDEDAIARGLVRLADEPGLLERLGQEAVTRPIRTWDAYAQDVLHALSRTGAAPGWPLPAIARRRPLLSCAITTYNRAGWLTHSLPRLLEATRPWRDVVEVVVCDNTSTDATPDVIARFRGEPGFHAHRNAQNVGMLGNLGATARVSNGAFVWLLGDDDLLVDGALENVLEGLARHPDVEMAYMNYAYTRFDAPERLADPAEVIAGATPIAAGGPNRYVAELRTVSGLNENLFTAIYACAFRREHALRAYQIDTRGSPFSSLATCVPSSVYALAALQDRPAWWVGEPALVVNMNVSWLRWALLWHLERMPDLFEEAERQGVDPDRLDRYRLQHLVEAERWVRAAYFEAEDAIRTHFSLARLLERCKHLPEFRRLHLAGVRKAYEEAWAAGRVAVDPIPPDELFARYGLAG